MDICRIAKKTARDQSRGAHSDPRHQKSFLQFMCSFVQLAGDMGTYTGAGKHADKATRHLIGPGG